MSAYASRFKGLLLLAALNTLLLAAAELFTRAARLDERLLAPLLYFQNADAEVHRLSADPALLYELAPGAAAQFDGPRRRRVSVNSLGFRGAQRAPAKPAGVRRLVFLGSSNTYGVLVGDEETYPAQLERLLNARGGPRYEVWNAGVCGYVPGQNIAAARRVLREFSPDLLVIQTHNYGRRPFLAARPFLEYFVRDRELFRENLRWCWPRALDALRYSAFARALAAGLNRLADRPEAGQENWNRIAELLPRQERALAAFAAEVRATTPVVLLRPPGDRAAAAPTGTAEIRLAGLLPRGSGPEYLEIHPGAEVYAWYARALAAELRRTGFIGGR